MVGYDVEGDLFPILRRHRAGRLKSRYDVEGIIIGLAHDGRGQVDAQRGVPVTTGVLGAVYPKGDGIALTDFHRAGKFHRNVLPALVTTTTQKGDGAEDGFSVVGLDISLPGIGQTAESTRSAQVIVIRARLAGRAGVGARVGVLPGRNVQEVTGAVGQGKGVLKTTVGDQFAAARSLSLETKGE